MPVNARGNYYKGCAWSGRGTGKPGKPAAPRVARRSKGTGDHKGTGSNYYRPDFTQKHYERLADSFREALRKFPDGDPLHPGVCFMLKHQIEMLQKDNPNFDEFRFIEWVNTP